MKTFVTCAALLLAGCQMVNPEVRLVNKRPAQPAGYVHASYTVQCRGPYSLGELLPVHYYGPDFTVDDALRGRERLLSCRAPGDADQNGPNSVD